MKPFTISYWSQYEFFHDSVVFLDSIHLQDGMAHTTIAYPYKSWGTIMRSSAPVPDRAGKYRLRSEEYSWRQNKGRRKVLHLLGLTSYEPILMGL